MQACMWACQFHRGASLRYSASVLTALWLATVFLLPERVRAVCGLQEGTGAGASPGMAVKALPGASRISIWAGNQGEVAEAAFNWKLVNSSVL